MSLFGKILLVVNLLAAGGFTYLAMQDYYGEKGKGNGRQNINASGLRHLLVLNGLPVEGPAAFPGDGVTAFVVDGPGGVPTTTVSKKLLDAYFQNVGAVSNDPNTLVVATAVPNQLAEVARVKARIEEILSKADNPAAKIALLKGWLLYEVETYPERVEIFALTEPSKEDPENNNKVRAKTPDELAKDVAELQKRLMARIDAVLAAPQSLEASITTPITDGDLAGAATDEEKAKLIDARLAKIRESRVVPLDATERARKLAHLLVHLSPEAAWQKRVLAVVGIRGYLRAVQAQSRAFAEMSIQLEHYLDADQRDYFAQINGRPGTSDTGEHRGLRQEAEEKTLLANRMSELKAKWVDQAIKEADLLAQRNTQLKELTDQLTKVKTQVDAMLARQTTIEAGLFEIQREVAITLDEVYQFEKELAERERKLANGGK